VYIHIIKNKNKTIIAIIMTIIMTIIITIVTI